VVSLPPQVPARLLFQSGPSGEPPPIDEIEELAGVTITQSSPGMVKYFRTPTSADPKQLILDWVHSDMVQVKILFPGCTKNMREKLRYECHHFWRNKSWILNAEFDDTLSLVPPRLTITGKRVAVDHCIVLVKKLAGQDVEIETSDLIIPRIEPITRNVSRSSSVNNDPVIGPMYRHRLSVHVPQVSILDVFGSQDNVRLEIFQKEFFLEGLSGGVDIPKPVVERLVAVLGPGVWFNITQEGTADIRVSSSEEDLEHTFGAVYVCTMRALSDMVFREWVSELTSVNLTSKKLFREIEEKWNVLIVKGIERGHLFVISKDKWKRFGAQIDLVGVNDELVAQIPQTHFETLIADMDKRFCDRISRASGAIVHKSRENKFFIFGEKENREFAKKVLMKSVAPNSIIFPAPHLWLDSFCSRSSGGVRKVEVEYACIVLADSNSVTISAVDPIARVSAYVAVMNEIHNFFIDRRDPKRSVPGMYANTDVLAAMGDVDIKVMDSPEKRVIDMSYISSALDVRILSLPRIHKTILCALKKDSVDCASLIIQNDINSIRMRYPDMTFEIAPSDIEKISQEVLEDLTKEVGCFAVGNLVISSSRFRLGMMRFILGTPDPVRQLALMRSGWSS